MVDQVSTYSASVTREDGYWLADVAEVPGAHAYARTLAKLRDELANSVILAADLSDDTRVSFRFHLADHTDQALDAAFVLAAIRSDLEEATAQVQYEVALSAQALVSSGMSVRDAAGALDLSAGRISQIIARSDATTERGRKAGRVSQASARVRAHTEAVASVQKKVAKAARAIEEVHKTARMAEKPIKPGRAPRNSTTKR
jgi:hypothetical protein